MLFVARIYLVFTFVMLGGLGLLGLVSPDMLSEQVALMPTSMAGKAELRGLYGGAFIAWSASLVIAWRVKSLRGGLLFALGLAMGGIAIARIVSMATDHEISFNLMAMATEGLIALACWVIYRSESKSAA